MIKEIYTANYGIVTISDIGEPDSNEHVGVQITDEDNNLLVEVTGICADDIIDDFDVENYIEKPLYEDPEDYDF